MPNRIFHKKVLILQPVKIKIIIQKRCSKLDIIGCPFQEIYSFAYPKKELDSLVLSRTRTRFFWSTSGWSNVTLTLIREHHNGVLNVHALAPSSFSLVLGWIEVADAMAAALTEHKLCAWKHQAVPSSQATQIRIQKHGWRRGDELHGDSRAANQRYVSTGGAVPLAEQSAADSNPSGGFHVSSDRASVPPAPIGFHAAAEQ
jgi:hypothetical protein